MLANNKLYLCSNEDVTFDSNYRYRVNVPEYEVRKKKGTNVTYFMNSKAFSDSIEINHDLFMKLIGSSLSCQSSMDKDIKCATFKGVYEYDKINDIVCSIIQKFLLCQNCDKPEVILYKKKGKLRHQCKACGDKRYVEENLASDNYEIILKSL
jgi:translation initiation factor 5